MTHHFVRSWLPRLALLLGSVTLALGAGEVAVRSLASQAVYPGRVLLTDSPQFDTAAHPEVRYLAEDTIRMVAVYRNEIEFDVTFITNNRGLVDTIDYPYSTRSSSEVYAVVGNSFAAGMHADDPWVTMLRKRAWEARDSVVLYNLGVEGTGFLHFEKILTYAERNFPFDIIVIVAISDDFRRPDWGPMVVDSLIYMCLRSELPGECRKRRSYARIIPPHISPGRLGHSAHQKAWRQPLSVLSSAAKRSHLLVLLVRQLRALFHSRPDWGRVGLQSIRRAFPQEPIIFLHVPQRNEVRNGRYDVDAEAIADSLAIEYEPLLYSCDWNAKMYYPHDSHLNQKGYDHLRECVAATLGIAQKKEPH